MEQFDEDFPTLIEAGFVAIKQFDETAAKQLFEAARLLRPDSPSPDIGRGYIHLSKLDLKPAIKAFEGAVAKGGENQLAQALLGMCYILDKKRRKEGEKLVREAKEQTDDPTVVNLCETALSWSDKELKKKDSKAPFFEEKTTS